MKLPVYRLRTTVGHTGQDRQSNSVKRSSFMNANFLAHSSRECGRHPNPVKDTLSSGEDETATQFRGNHIWLRSFPDDQMKNVNSYPRETDVE